MAELGSYLLTEPDSEGADRNTWQPLRFLNLYRLVLGAVFVALFNFGRNIPPLGKSDPELFYWVSVGYVIFALAAIVASTVKRPGFVTQVYIQTGADILALTLMMHASGGIDSGLGMLFVVSIAGASMLTEGRTAGLFAALATLAILSEQLYAHFNDTYQFTSYPRAGMLGATIFATAILAHVLAHRIRESEALATRRGVDLANMAKLTEFVIQHLPDGVVVVDSEQHIRLMNSAAWELLGRPSASDQRTLESVSPGLAGQLERWRYGDFGEVDIMHSKSGDTELLPRFVTIGNRPSAGIVIFLDDVTAASRQAQQLKLAALGRLTASIAHEVRNPLGAISHAGELLGESTDLQGADRRCIEIILQQSRRVNTIIENVLALGRRGQSRAEEIPLQEWLDRFLDEFRAGVQAQPDALACSVKPPSIHVWFDPIQLHQVLWNLARNGLRHAHEETPRVAIEARRFDDGRPYLDVIDNGPAISEEQRSKIFEPFFTTEPSGTGLGLYIARELAQCNGARLDYLQSPDGGKRFRITFAAPASGQGVA
jgi:two-component system sensor histidine kinase PilS (NtrC family)